MYVNLNVLFKFVFMYLPYTENKFVKILKLVVLAKIYWGGRRRVGGRVGVQPAGRGTPAWQSQTTRL